MRRASTCLAVLGLAAAGAAGRRLGRADGQVQSDGRADPRLPAAPATSSAPAPPSKPNTRSPAPNTRLAAADDRRQLLPAEGHDAAPERLPDVHRRDARTVRPDQVPERLAGRPDRQGARLRRRSAANASKRAANCRPSTRRAAASSSSPTATRRCRWKSCPTATTSTSAAAAASAPSSISEVPLVESVPGAPFASVKTIKVKVGSAYKSNGKTIYYGTAAEDVPEGRLPGQDRSDLR